MIEMKIQLLLMVFAFPAIYSFNNTDRYCYIESCDYGKHIMCDYPTSVAYSCGRVIRNGLTENEKKRIVDVHNYYRWNVFSGNEWRGNPGPQPAAVVNFNPLQWDRELANVAQRWAEQCIAANDVCRNVDRFLVGQNYAIQDYIDEMDEDVELMNLQMLVEFWYNEVDRFDRNAVQKFSQPDAIKNNTLHYTQMVWGSTKKIGCGAIRYAKLYELNLKILLVCNYGPSGNRHLLSVYSTQEDMET